MKLINFLKKHIFSTILSLIVTSLALIFWSFIEPLLTTDFSIKLWILLVWSILLIGVCLFVNYKKIERIKDPDRLGKREVQVLQLYETEPMHGLTVSDICRSANLERNDALISVRLLDSVGYIQHIADKKEGEYRKLISPKGIRFLNENITR